MKIGDKVVYKGKNKGFFNQIGEITEIDYEHDIARVVFKGITTVWVLFSSIEPVKEEITKPKHYHRGGIDVIGFAKQNFSFEEVKGFFRINILKYSTRYDEKNGVDDLIKANDYLQMLKEWEEEHEADKRSSL